jgi:tRNA-specific 2-thiouridylase
MTKDDTRELAREEGLPAADAHDSQGVCFAPDGDYRGLLSHERPDAFVPGDIVDAEGHVLGRHAGTVGFTIGQRKGLGLAQGPFFVQSIDPAMSTVVVGRGRMPAVSRFELTQAALSCGVDEANELGIQAQTHFHARPCPARLVEGEGGSYVVEVTSAGVLAVTGQACALYHGDVVMGGGIIGRVVTASA